MECKALAATKVNLYIYIRLRLSVIVEYFFQIMGNGYKLIMKLCIFLICPLAFLVFSSFKAKG